MTNEQEIEYKRRARAIFARVDALMMEEDANALEVLTVALSMLATLLAGSTRDEAVSLMRMTNDSLDDMISNIIVPKVLGQEPLRPSSKSECFPVSLN